MLRNLFNDGSSAHAECLRPMIIWTTLFMKNKKNPYLSYDFHQAWKQISDIPSLNALLSFNPQSLPCAPLPPPPIVGTPSSEEGDPLNVPQARCVFQSEKSKGLVIGA